MNIDNMTTEQLENLHAQISKKLGIYCMMTVSTEDVKDRLQEMLENGDIDTLPSDENIDKACNLVWGHYEGGDFIDTLEFIAELAIEKSKQL